MSKQTKIEKGILYKEDYEALKPYRERILQSARLAYAYQLKWNDLNDLQPIYKKYYPKEVLDMNCNKCLVKMLDNMASLIKRTEKEEGWTP